MIDSALGDFANAVRGPDQRGVIARDVDAAVNDVVKQSRTIIDASPTPEELQVATAVGIDPIWFGIFIVLMCELGMITPPVGMNLYVVQGVRTDGGPFRDVVRGAIPYAVIMLLFTLLIIAFPQIVLWLPQGMYG